MPVQASSSDDLAAAGRKQHGAGARFLLIGGVMFALGVLLWVLDANFLAAVLLSLATVPTLVGVALELSAGVAKRSAAGKPFA
jgi:VIT1/CCC1 family predicted Fe2+/Mn2+ transporter